MPSVPMLRRTTVPSYATAIGLLIGLIVSCAHLAGCGPVGDAAKRVVGWCFDGIVRGLAESRDAGAPASSGGEAPVGGGQTPGASASDGGAE